MSLLGPTGKCSKRQVRTLVQVIGTLAARTRTFGPRHCSNISAPYRNWAKTKSFGPVPFAILNLSVGSYSKVELSHLSRIFGRPDSFVIERFFRREKKANRQKSSVGVSRHTKEASRGPILNFSVTNVPLSARGWEPRPMYRVFVTPLHAHTVIHPTHFEHQMKMVSVVNAYTRIARHVPARW